MNKKTNAQKQDPSQVEVVALLENIFYPRGIQHSLDWTIAKFHIVKCNKGTFPEGIYPTDGVGLSLSCKGTMPKLEYGAKYAMVLNNITIDPKYGLNADVVTMRMAYDLDNELDRSSFLALVLTSTQIESARAASVDVFKALKEEDIDTLCTIKGIKVATAERLLERYNDCKDNYKAYIELEKFGLTRKAIDKLIRAFKSPDIVIDIITTNPYALIGQVEGYGWNRADKIALNQGFPHDGEARCKSFAVFALQDEMNQSGNMWCPINSFLSFVSQECYPVSDEKLMQYIREITVTDISQFTDSEIDKIVRCPITIGTDFQHKTVSQVLYFDTETEQIGLLKNRLVEYRLAQEFKRLKDTARPLAIDETKIEGMIKDSETKAGFVYTTEQEAAIRMSLHNPISILTGKAGCVDGETEFFTGKGWKKIKDYCKGDKVLQYNDDGTTSLVEPEEYYKYECDTMYHFKTKYGIDQKLSEEHNVLTVSRKGVKHVNTVSEIVAIQKEKGFNGLFITTFGYNGSGIEYSDDEIRLIVACIADGSINNKRIVFNLKKDRKKIRLRNLLTKVNYRSYEMNGGAKGYTRFNVYMPLIKVFPEDWYNCSQHQLEIIADELQYWDACVNYTDKNNLKRIRLSSTIKANADFIQFAYSACGMRASISIKDRRGQSYNNKYIRKSVEYSILVSHNPLVGLCDSDDNGHHKTPIVTENSSDGYKYCFSVPTHTWVMRYNNCIAVTKNCGKTSSVAAVVEIMERSGLRIALCALSGRASSKMSELTGLTGSTIHRLLGIKTDENDNSEDQPSYGHDHKLPIDLVVLDETSMVGSDLVLSLVEAIPDGGRLLMVGDIAQLESIGVGNVLKDCMTSGYIPLTSLTQIQRQQSNSAIITESLKVSVGASLFANSFVGTETRGNLQDLRLQVFDSPASSQRMILDEYSRLLSTGVDSRDIQVIVPMRMKGNISCRVLNKALQRIANGNEQKKELRINQNNENGGIDQIIYRMDDKVIVLRNDYHARSISGEQISIYNGNVGYICGVDVDNQSLVVDLLGIGKVIIKGSKLQEIDLAYAITVHKKQGDSVPYAIVGLDSSCYALASRELIYTAITRARKFCSLVVQNSTFCTAVKTSHVKQKRTWLKRDLLKLLMAEQKTSVASLEDAKEGD